MYKLCIFGYYEFALVISKMLRVF